MPVVDKGGAGQRATPRFKIFRPAEMERAGVKARVHLLNISIGGALIHADAVPAPGEEIGLSSGIALGAARVQWTNGPRFGVAFRTPLRPDQLDAILQRTGEAPRLTLPPAS